MVYNLLTEKWIPIIRLDGRWERVGICTALREAGRIRQIAASNPMDRVALLRFLLAVLYWCRGNPPGQEEKERVAGDGQFPAEWFDKLEERRECFNLLGEGKRFYQNEAYKQKEPQHTVNYLIHEVPSGTNKWHFRHTMDRVDGLCPACCAMGLIRLPVFATSGGRGMSSSTGKSFGINAKPPLYVVPVGKSLAATLRLSWRTTGLELGTPEWEAPGNKLPQKGEVPLLTGLTWLPRSVWLGDPEEPESVCASCGRKEQLIRRCVFDGKGTSKAEGRLWRDPHVVYGTTSDGKSMSLQTGDALGRTDAAANHWAKTMAGIVKGQGSGVERPIWVVGFSTVQNDKYLEATEWLVSGSGSPQQDQDCAAKLERWQKEGATLARQICPKEKSSSRETPLELRSAVDAIRPEVEARVFAATGDLLAGNDRVWERAASEYRPMMGTIATSLSPGFTTRALQRRNQIADSVPNMTARPEAKPRKPKAKKGGDQ
ncbi:MAG: type I-E CRISPR-associated protein Cse1/CasA [Planctomycetota bacterium]|nr:type I-E CRISPR-associated protein Cse1/CasA [Planctomycetota bacterium]